MFNKIAGVISKEEKVRKLSKLMGKLVDQGGKKMLEIKKMSDCTIEERVNAWNKGFEGYYFDMTTTDEAFEKRGAVEDLSEDLSVVAFEGGEPVGIVRSGLREIGGQKISWNGGTGVAPDVRGKGVGKKMMEATLDILMEAGVDVATLEAVSENTPAIALYQKLGYSIVDEVHFMQLKGPGANVEFFQEEAIELKKAMPEEAGALLIYRGDFTWQTQWQSVKDGEALFAVDSGGEVKGYTYYRKNHDEAGKHVSTVLYQCVADRERTEVVNELLAGVFGDFSDDINRVAVNVPQKMNKATYGALIAYGFESTTKQVFMKKEL